MKKNIFTVPILSLVASIVLKLFIYIIAWIRNIATPEGQPIVWGKGYIYGVFGASVVLLIFIGIMLRKRDFDKITIFKSATVLVAYMAIIWLVFRICTQITGSLTPNLLMLELNLSYPFFIYDSIRSVIASININMTDFWIDQIAMILFPYMLVFFGKSKNTSL